MRFYEGEDGNYYSFTPNGKGGGTVQEVFFGRASRIDSFEEKEGKIVFGNDSKTKEIKIVRTFVEEVEGTVF